jgi:phosphate transport system permease protein
MTNAHDITTTIEAGLARRYRAEARFKAYGLAGLAFAGLMLVVLLVTIIRPGITGFMRHEITLDLDTAAIAQQLRDDPAQVDFYTLTNAAMQATQGDGLVDKVSRHQFLSLAGTFAAADAKRQVMAHPDQWGSIVSVSLPLADNVDQLLKGKIDRSLPEMQRPLNDRQLAWVDGWQKEGRISYRFNSDFFRRGDSRAPEAAGFLGAIVGSLISLAVCLAVALPIAIMAAITLEEFARKTRVAEALEVIINNLAAVPSIIYGLLGLSVYLQLFGMPRSSPLVGGLTLAMLIMPVMIIAARASIRAVPPSMRQAATALGASPLQVVRHHVLPYALPGILTGTILSVCRALGESAPLLMVGMVAFVADVPRGVTDPATAMPVQIFLWASSPELGFIEKTSSAIMVLLVILLLLNWAAIKLRNKSQLTWN